MNKYSLQADPSLPGQQQPVGAQLAPDSLRHFQADWKEDYSGKDFNYDRVEGQAQNYLSRFIRWLVESLGEVLGINVSPEALSVMEFIIYALLGVLALYLVVRYVTQAPLSQLFSKKEPAMSGAVWQEDNLQEIDLDSLLKEAQDSGNYRLAVRYHFLRLLKRLNQAGQIDYHPEKTNRDYLTELSDGNLKTQFSSASRIFEYTWYGEQSINVDTYRGIVSLFENSQHSSNYKQSTL